MVTAGTIRAQLKNIGHRFHIRGRSEYKELSNVIESGETILQCVYGYYQGGSGLLVATDRRLLLIDKRPFYLSLEDIPYDRIRNLVFSKHFLLASLKLQCGAKKLVFRSVSDAVLKEIKKIIDVKFDNSVPEELTLEQTNIRKRATYKPYLNPGWSPHSTGILRRQHPVKFYAENTTPNRPAV